MKGVGRGRRFPLGLAEVRGEPAGLYRPGNPVKTRDATEPTCAGGSAGGVETGPMALPREEMEGTLLL